MTTEAGSGTELWTEFTNRLAFRGYKLEDFPTTVPAICLYKAWQRNKFSTTPRDIADSAQDAIDALIAVCEKSYARCVCGESITGADMNLGNVAEVVRDGKHLLIHYESCRQVGDELA